MKKQLAAQKVKVSGDVPAPRFGHTFTMVSPTKAVLFGGAVSIAGKFVITNETYLFDLELSRWSKLNFKHEFVPSQRAAHAAVAVSDMQMIIYGGAASGNQGLLKDELYILDLRKEPVWKIIQVSAKSTPGQRYGHTMLFNKPYLVVFGGNSGNRAENDVWLLNILKGPFSWQKYEFPNKIMPCPRVYHSAAICEEGSALGMMVVFGGRKETKKDHNGSQRDLQVAALNDIWGLRKHRDGSWDWVTPPKSQTYTPLCRYQHLVTFVGTHLVIMGGRSNNPEEAVSLLEVYDTEKSEWTRFSSISRYRHATALFNRSKLFVHGGFQPQMASQPLESMMSIDLSPLITPKPSLNNWTPSHPHNMTATLKDERTQERAPKEERNVLAPHDNIANMMANSKEQQKPPRRDVKENEDKGRSSRIRSGTSNVGKKERELTPSRIINASKNIRLSNQVVVATGDHANSMQIQKVPVNSLLQESKKLTAPQEEQYFCDINSIQLADSILQTLCSLGPQVKGSSAQLFPFKREKVVRLCQEAARLVGKESSLVGVRPPVKVFGGIYGRFFDLMRLFDHFGFPDEHEMESNEYVFLGNYVDKGFNSLETVCLLMALKLKFPEHITLLRGKHEDSTINRICGLGEECALRLGDSITDPNSAFSHINGFFDSLPLAAAIEDRFLCVNSGIGSINSLIEVRDVARPVKVRSCQTVMDLLWSGTPCEKRLNYDSKHCSDEEIQEFLDSNGLQMLINTRDGVPQGVDQQHHTLSVFSVANFAQSNNKAGILKINKNMSIVPHLLPSSPTKKGSWVTELPPKTGITFTSVQAEFRNNMFNL